MICFVARVGYLSYGFMQAGFEIRAGVDVDTAALITFEHNHPAAIPIRADVIELTSEKLRTLVGGTAIFGLLGGPPCQDLALPESTIQMIRATSFRMNMLVCWKKFSPAFF